MKKKYFQLQLKSFAKICPTIILITILTIGTIAFTCGLLLMNNQNDESKQRVSIGVVGNLESTYLKVGLYALQNVDDSRYYFDFKELEEERAIKLLKEGKINGYLYIPDGYIKNIYRGINSPAKYVSMNNPDGFGSIVSDEVTMRISDLVTESQVGMYSMQDVAHDYDGEDIRKHIDKLMLKYVSSIMGRNNFFGVTTLGIADKLSFGGYYACGLLMIIMLLWGISCNRYFSSRNIAFSRLLKISGVDSFSQILCEFGAFLCLNLTVLLAFVGMFSVITADMVIPIPEICDISLSDALIFVIKLIPVVLMLSAMQTAIYELAPNVLGAGLVQFLITFGLGYLSGCFYPNYFFPEAVQKIAECLPVGVGFSYIRKSMSGGIGIKELFNTLSYFAAFFAVAVLSRERRIKYE